MKKALIIFGLFLIVSQIAAQATQGKIVYRVDMDHYFEKMELQDRQGFSGDILAMAANYIKNFESIIRFNRDYSEFGVSETLTVGEGNEHLDTYVKSLISNGKYYSSSRNGAIVWETELDGLVYNVKSGFKTQNWQLSKETKQIGEFLCLKAVLIQESNGKQRATKAWYTPEISRSLGPKDYIGQLPGLILELEEPLLRYKASLIELNKEQNIKWPTKGNFISKDSFEVKVNKAIQKIKAGNR